MRELDKILDELKVWVDASKEPVHESHTCVRELCAFVEAAGEGVLWRQFQTCQQGLQLRISKIILDLPREADDAIHASKLSLQDIADEWTEILWKRVMRQSM